MRLGPLPPVADLPANRVLDLVKRDKKVVDGSLHFVLPAGIGATRIVDDVAAEEAEGGPGVRRIRSDLSGGWACRRARQIQVMRVESVAVRQDGRTLDAVLQLAHVARP